MDGSVVSEGGGDDGEAQGDKGALGTFSMLKVSQDMSGAKLSGGSSLGCPAWSSCAKNAGADSSIALTPVVFCAVSAVIALMA